MCKREASTEKCQSPSIATTAARVAARCADATTSWNTSSITASTSCLQTSVLAARELHATLKLSQLHGCGACTRRAALSGGSNRSSVGPVSTRALLIDMLNA